MSEGPLVETNGQNTKQLLQIIHHR